MRNHPKLKGRLRFTLFNLIFISFYQHFLILLISTPLLIAAQNSNATQSIIDLIAASLFLVFLVTETVADNQQFRFQNLKKSIEKSNGIFSESLNNGFLSEGLWRFVRHPNYASEQAIWIIFYLFGVAASGRWFNWTLTGSVLLVLLFLGSTHLTESISSDKYPGYNKYRKSVPKFFPRIIRNSDSQLINQK
jgi:steroid 5-alpha reductase family enzyme